MYINLHEKYPLFLPDFNENRIFSTIFEKCPNTKFHENPSSGGPVVPCEQNGQIDIAMLIVAFSNLPNEPNTAYS